MGNKPCPPYQRNKSYAALVFTACLLALLILGLFGMESAMATEYKRTLESYAIPDVVLMNQDGKKVALKELLQSKKPVSLDFIFGTCTTICPILSVGYANLQQKLGADSDRVQLVSISIDPENDTPKVMKEYLKRYRAKPGWQFLTGKREDIDKVMRAFDAYIPNKMAHYPLTLLKGPKEEKWVRIFGLMGSAEFLSEFQKVGGK